MSLAEQAAKLWHALHLAAIAALGAMAADPQLVTRFEQLGGGPWCFLCGDDLFLIYAAIVYARDREEDRDAAAHQAVRYLVAHGWWDPNAPRDSRGMRWSAESVASLFDTFPGSVSAMEAAANRLIELERRTVDARECCDRLRSILNTTFEDARALAAGEALQRTTTVPVAGSARGAA